MHISEVFGYLKNIISHLNEVKDVSIFVYNFIKKSQKI